MKKNAAYCLKTIVKRDTHEDTTTENVSLICYMLNKYKKHTNLIQIKKKLKQESFQRLFPVKIFCNGPGITISELKHTITHQNVQQRARPMGRLGTSLTTFLRLEKGKIITLQNQLFRRWH